MNENIPETFAGGETAWHAVDRLDLRMQDLSRTAAGFSRAMTTAFMQSATGARGFDDVLKSLYLRLSDLALRSALRPLEQGLASGFQNLFAGFSALPVSGEAGGKPGGVTAFASGGVIGAPSYFPLMSGGIGLAGEAGPEAILPLARGSDGRLGVASAQAATSATVVVNISTPDADSFRRSESFVTGQIARAVARGQRGL